MDAQPFVKDLICKCMFQHCMFIFLVFAKNKSVQPMTESLLFPVKSCTFDQCVTIRFFLLLLAEKCLFRCLLMCMRCKDVINK